MQTRMQQQKLGEALAQVLGLMPESHRGPFLASLEQEARALGNLEYLREIRAYRCNQTSMRLPANDI